MPDDPFLPTLNPATAPSLPTFASPMQIDPASAANGHGYLTNLLLSSVASVPELIGISPHRIGLDEQNIQQFRAANPWSAALGEIAISAIPYGIGINLGRAALQAVPATRALLASVAANSPRALAGGASTVGAGFVRGALEIAPFEAARIGAAAAVGDEGTLGSVAGAAGLDLALSGGLFAAGGIFRAIRGDTSQGARVRSIVGPEYDLRQPAQQRLQTLYDYRNSGARIGEDVRPMIDSEIQNLETMIRGEGASGTKAYIGDLWNGADSESLARLFNDRNDVARAATPEGAGMDLIRRRFIQASGSGFPMGEWQRVAQQVGLPQDWLSAVQFPRLVEARTNAGAMRAQTTVTRNLRQVHDGWWIEPEQNSGLFVMARKLDSPNLFPQAGDRWMLFKTNNPDRFLGKDVFGQSSERSWRFHRQVEGPQTRETLEALNKDHPDSVLAASRRFSNTLSAEVTNTAAEAGWASRAALAAAPEGLANAAKDSAPLLSDFWQMMKGYVAPAQAQFRKAPLAERTRIRAQNIFDMAAAKASILSFGNESVQAGQNLYKRIFKPGNSVGGIEGMVRGLDNADLPVVQRLLLEADGLEGVLARVRTELDNPAQRERLTNFFTELDAIDARKLSEIKATERVYGLDQFEARPGHFGFSHLWQGDFRQRVVDEAGKLIAMGSGRTHAEAAASARELANRLGGRTDKGVFRRADWEQDFKNAEEIVRVRSAAQPSVAKLAEQTPNIYQVRKGTLGYVGSTAQLSKRELADILHANTQQHYNYLAKLITTHELHQEVLDAGRRYGTQVMHQLAYRIQRMAGNKGLVDRSINQFVSKGLGNWLGSNAADRLTNGYKRAESMLTLGMGNMGYVASNALQFLQTVVPKIALVRNANPARLHEFMGFIPDMAPNGTARGVIGFLEPARIAAAGWRAMAKPSEVQAEIFNRAVREGLITRGAFEEFLGQKSLFGKEVLDASTAGQNPAVALLERISNRPAQKVEELTRTHALLTGEILARTMGVTNPEQVYQFAKQFTQRTMYGYTAADRAKLFNGPAGGVFGLFKNWSFHYINDMGLYASEAFKRGNFAPLMWSLGSQGMLAGVGSLPLIGAVDGLQRVFGNQSLMERLYRATGSPEESPLGDAAWFGLPAFLGVSLQSQLNAPFANPVHDVNWLMNLAIVERARRVGQLGQYAFDNWQAGMNPFENRRTWDLANYAFGPRVTYKILSQVEDGALKAIRNGQPIVSGVTPTQEFLNGIGLTPTRIARAYELSAENFAQQDAREAATARLGEAYARSLEAGNSQAMTFIIQRALETGADLGSVMRSASLRLRTSQREQLPMNFLRQPGAVERQQLLGLSGS